MIQFFLLIVCALISPILTIVGYLLKESVYKKASSCSSEFTDMYRVEKTFHFRDKFAPRNYQIYDLKAREYVVRIDNPVDPIKGRDENLFNLLPQNDDWVYMSFNRNSSQTILPYYQIQLLDEEVMPIISDTCQENCIGAELNLHQDYQINLGGQRYTIKQENKHLNIYNYDEDRKIATITGYQKQRSSYPVYYVCCLPELIPEEKQVIFALATLYDQLNLVHTRSTNGLGYTLMIIGFIGNCLLILLILAIIYYLFDRYNIYRKIVNLFNR